MAADRSAAASKVLVRSLVVAAGVALLFVGGTFVTLGWFSRGGAGVHLDASRWREVGGMLLALMGLTTLNLLLRWARWHFLTRRLGARLAAKTSVRIWFATLPALLTPFYLGELVRGAFLARKTPGAFVLCFRLWLIERGLDAFAIASLWAAGGGNTLAGVLLLGLAILFGAALLRRKNIRTPESGRCWPAVLLVALSVASWLLPAVGLWLMVLAFGGKVDPFSATRAFSSGSLLGGLSGIPLGTGVTGSISILRLVDAGVARGTAISALALFRMGTAWYAVLLGAGLALAWRKDLRRLWAKESGPSHFDELADEYREQIPEHVRGKLLSRKIAMMTAALPPGPLRGLDLGCGHGWYACEMAKVGHIMTGVDLSAEQIENARRQAREEGVELRVMTASGTALPFPDASFDFVYSINVLHHIEDQQDQATTFTEILRVLTPDGKFFLHEINIENPLFRLYMGYLFPVIRDIDEGTERWIRPRRLPSVKGGEWDREVRYFTFLPDFAPSWVLRLFAGVESALERSFIACWSAHYLAVLRPSGPAGELKSPVPSATAADTSTTTPGDAPPLPQVGGK